MYRVLAAAILLVALPACIELDEELFVDTDTPTDEPLPTGTPGPVRPDDPVPPTQPDAPDVGEVVLTPDAVAQCDTILVSLTLDFAETVSDVRFLGPSTIDVLTLDVRSDEVLATVSVPAASPLGTNHVLLEHDDDTTTFLRDAFTVTVGSCD